MYLVDCKALSKDEYTTLKSNLDRSTFLAVYMVGVFQVLRVTLNPNQTIESVIKAFPILKRCKIELFT